MCLYWYVYKTEQNVSLDVKFTVSSLLQYKATWIAGHDVKKDADNLRWHFMTVDKLTAREMNSEKLDYWRINHRIFNIMQVPKELIKLKWNNKKSIYWLRKNERFIAKQISRTHIFPSHYKFLTRNVALDLCKLFKS